MQPGLTPAQISADLAASAVGQGGAANVGAGLIQATGALAVADGVAGVGLVVDVSEDAYAGNAQCEVFVDGTQYGGVDTVTASHAAGQSQNVTISGIPEQFAFHDIAVTFLNDLYDGSPSTDRNLYVNAIQFDGAAVPGGSASPLSDGTQHFTAMAPNNDTG